MEPIIVNGELYHHGISGQKWGVRNGPPYPLKGGMHTDLEMGQAKKKVGTLSGYFKNKKLKKQRAKALEKARAARVEKQARAEEERKHQEELQKVVKSGTATDLMKYRGELSSQDIQEALQRINLEKQLSEYAKSDLSAAEKKIDNVMNKIGRAADWAEKGIKFYNVASKIANSVSGEEILPPIQNPMERINYKRGLEQLRGDRAQADIKEKESKKMDEVIGQAKATKEKLQAEAKTTKEAAKQAKEATKSMKRGYTAQEKYAEQKAKEEKAQTDKEMKKEAKKAEKEAKANQKKIDSEARKQLRITQKEQKKQRKQDEKMEKAGNKIIREQERADEKRKDINKNYENDLRNREYDYLRSIMDANEKKKQQYIEDKKFGKEAVDRELARDKESNNTEKNYLKTTSNKPTRAAMETYEKQVWDAINKMEKENKEIRGKKVSEWSKEDQEKLNKIEKELYDKLLKRK